VTSPAWLSHSIIFLPNLKRIAGLDNSLPQSEKRVPTFPLISFAFCYVTFEGGGLKSFKLFRSAHVLCCSLHPRWQTAFLTDNPPQLLLVSSTTCTSAKLGAEVNPFTTTFPNLQDEPGSLLLPCPSGPELRLLGAHRPHEDPRGEPYPR